MLRLYFPYATLACMLHVLIAFANFSPIAATSRARYEPRHHPIYSEEGDDQVEVAVIARRQQLLLPLQIFEGSRLTLPLAQWRVC